MFSKASRTLQKEIMDPSLRSILLDLIVYRFGEIVFISSPIIIGQTENSLGMQLSETIINPPDLIDRPDISKTFSN